MGTIKLPKYLILRTAGANATLWSRFRHPVTGIRHPRSTGISPRNLVRAEKFSQALDQFIRDKTFHSPSAYWRGLEIDPIAAKAFWSGWHDGQQAQADSISQRSGPLTAWLGSASAADDDEELTLTAAIEKLQDQIQGWTERARDAERRAAEQADLIRQQAAEIAHLKTQLGITVVQKKWAEAAAEYLAWGKSTVSTRGRAWSSQHVHQQTVRLTWWGKALKSPLLTDINLTKVEAVIDKIPGKASKTRHDFVAVLKGFISWCRKHSYLTANPLQNLSTIKHQPEEEWRALNLEETQRLLQRCKPDRRLLYEIALGTGFRAGEIAALRVEHLDIAGSCLRPDSAEVKNRKKTRQPIPRLLTDRLTFHVKGKEPKEALVFVSGHYTENFVNDLKRAGIERHTAEGLAVFHSLRKTYTTLLQEMSGASLVEAQKLTRHSDPRLTANTYTKTGGARLQSLLDSFGARILA